ncbi:MAG TPA: type II toxin-antitoxin system prevent-host-death family antitoxin [Candidatus Angelobacter sp.]
MREISISEFRAKCHSLIREVSMTKQPLRITHDGQPLAEIAPPSPVRKGRKFLGSGMDTFDILDDDIVGPIIDFNKNLM